MTTKKTTTKAGIRTIEQTESKADNKSYKKDYKHAPNTLGGDRHKHSAKGDILGSYPLSDTDTEDHSEFLQEKDQEESEN